MKMVGDYVVCDEGVIEVRITDPYIEWCHGHNLEVITVNDRKYYGHRFRIKRRPLLNRLRSFVSSLKQGYKAYRGAA